MSLNATHQSIDTATKACLRGFDALLTCTQNSKLSVQLQDNLSRFRIWAANLGAYQREEDKRSADHRLKSAPEVRQRVLELLGDLAETLDELRQIAAGERPDGSLEADQPVDHAGPDTGANGDDHSEAKELSLMIADAITNLMKVSILVRKATGRDRYLRAASLAGNHFSPDFDIGHVGESFPKVRRAGWLQVRLGEAIAQRRQFLRYTREHHNRLAEEEDMDEPLARRRGAQPGENMSRSGKSRLTVTQSVVATTKASTLDPTTLEQIMENPDDGFEDDTTSRATSQVSLKEDGQQILRMVKLEDLSPTKAPFECPYCWSIVQFHRDRTWKKHVFSDLRAYACTFEYCEQGLFTNREQWFQHELDVHRRQWTCASCPSRTFSTEDAFIQHVTKHHHSSLTPETRTALVHASSRPVTAVSAHACPLCDDWADRITIEALNRGIAADHELTTSINDFKTHLGRHQETLALFAIPPLESEREDLSDRRDNDVDRTDNQEALLQWQANADPLEGDYSDNQSDESLPVSNIDITEEDRFYDAGWVKPIKFKDAIGRKFKFPYHMCKTWKGMEGLIKQAFAHVDGLGDHVQAGHYDLTGPDGEIILPQIWESYVQPDWEISMYMWPMEEKTEDKAVHDNAVGNQPQSDANFQDGEFDLDTTASSLRSDNERLKLMLQRVQTENEILRAQASSPSAPSSHPPGFVNDGLTTKPKDRAHTPDSSVVVDQSVADTAIRGLGEKNQSAPEYHHWASNIAERMSLCGKSALPDNTAKVLPGCFGNVDMDAPTHLVKDSFDSVFEVHFDKSDLLVGLYFRRSDSRARIIITANYSSPQQRQYYCTPLKNLVARRSEACLQLCRVTKDRKRMVWAQLIFSSFEPMALFYCTFVCMKRQDPRPLANDGLLVEDFGELESEDTGGSLEFAGKIKHDNMIHALRLWHDGATGVLRLEASALRGPMQDVPIWTAFVTRYRFDPDWPNIGEDWEVSLASLRPFVFVHGYSVPKNERGEHILPFTTSKDGRDFVTVWSSLATKSSRDTFRDTPTTADVPEPLHAPGTKTSSRPGTVAAVALQAEHGGSTSGHPTEEPLEASNAPTTLPTESPRAVLPRLEQAPVKLENANQASDDQGAVIQPSAAEPLPGDQLMSLAAYAENAAAGLHTFRESLPQAATDITATIRELFAISSSLRELHRLMVQEPPRIRPDNAQKIASMQRKILLPLFEDMFDKFAASRTRLFSVLWDEMNQSARIPPRRLVQALRDYHHTLQKVLSAHTSLPDDAQSALDELDQPMRQTHTPAPKLRRKNSLLHDYWERAWDVDYLQERIDELEESRDADRIRPSNLGRRLDMPDEQAKSNYEAILADTRRELADAIVKRDNASFLCRSAGIDLELERPTMPDFYDETDL